MSTDTEIRVRGMEILMKELGQVEAERFIRLMIQEPFDYTKSQRGLFEKKTIEEISREAMEARKTGGSNA